MYEFGQYGERNLVQNKVLYITKTYSLYYTSQTSPTEKYLRSQAKPEFLSPIF